MTFFSSRLLQQLLSKIYPTKILVFLFMISIRFVIYINAAQYVRLAHRSLFKSLYFFTIAFYINHVWVCFITIKLNGDIGENPGPQLKPCDSLSICHWNLNSYPAHNFLKLSLLRAYISINKFNIICLSETLFGLFHLMMAIWRYQIQITLKEALFLFITLIHYH